MPFDREALVTAARAHTGLDDLGAFRSTNR
jgi:hypothetical protein